MKSIISYSIAAVSALFLAVSVHADDQKGEVLRILVPDMACESCSATVSDSLKKLEGVSDAVVILKRKVVLVSTEKKIDNKILKKTVSDTGFKAKKIERLDLSFEKAKEKLENENS